MLTSLETLQEKNLIRKRICNEPIKDLLVKFDGKTCRNFTSNDYLGLSKHPEVISGCKQGFDHYGFGSGASPLVSGYTQAQKDLEQQFADLVNRPAALFFNSGYQANTALMQCFGNKDTLVIADKFIHASLLDGLSLSKSKLKRFPHLDLASAELFLSSADASMTKILLSESIFSMEGDIADIEQLIHLSKKHNAALFLDDAHGFGVLGKNGLGICNINETGCNDIRLLSTPLGKAVGGIGAVISGSKQDIEYLLQFARSYRYSTALPPALAVGLSKSLALLATESWRREKLFENINLFINQINKTDLQLISDDITPIKSILIGDNRKAENLQQKLLELGFFVSCIRPPTVPENTARLRVTLNALHQKEDIIQLVTNLKAL